ncbi:hypothetical protein D3C72_2307640 [compost metagenome]
MPLAIIMAVPAWVAILPASTLVVMPPRDRWLAAPPAMASMAGVIERTTGRCSALGSLAGGAV